MAACALAILATSVWGQRAPGVVDGEMWLSSAPEERKAFLVGAGNMMALETAYAKKKATPTPQASEMTSKAISGLTGGGVGLMFAMTRSRAPVFGCELASGS